MKRFLFTLMVCGLAAPSLMAASVFQLSNSEMLSLTDLAGFTNDADYIGFATFTSPGPAYGSSELAGMVGFHAFNAGEVGDLEYVGVGTETPLDLTGYDTFMLKVCNDNNQGWQYRLFADDDATEANGANYSGPWQTILPGNCLGLSVDLAGLDLSNVTLGFQVGRSDQPDSFHTSIAPVPVPGAVLLAGMGAALVGWVRRRHAL